MPPKRPLSPISPIPRITRSKAKVAAVDPTFTDPSPLQNPLPMPPTKKVKLVLKHTPKNKTTQTRETSTSPRQQLRVKKNRKPRRTSKVAEKIVEKLVRRSKDEKKRGRQPSSSSEHYGGDEYSGGLDGEFLLSPSTNEGENEGEVVDSPATPKSALKPKNSTTSEKKTSRPRHSSGKSPKRIRKTPPALPLGITKCKAKNPKRKNRWGETLSEEREREREEFGDELSPRLNPSPTDLETMIRGVKNRLEKTMAPMLKKGQGAGRSVDVEKEFHVYGFPPTPALPDKNEWTEIHASMQSCCLNRYQTTHPSRWPPNTVCTKHITHLFHALCHSCHFAKASLTWIPWGLTPSASRTIAWTHPDLPFPSPLFPPTPGVQQISYPTLGFGPLYRDFYETVDALDIHLSFTTTNGGIPYVTSELGQNPLERRMGIRGESVVKWRERWEYDWEMGDDGNYRILGLGIGSVRGVETSGYEALERRVGIASNPFFESFEDEPTGVRTRSVTKGIFFQGLQTGVSEAYEYDTEESLTTPKANPRLLGLDDQMSFDTHLAPWHPAYQTENPPMLPEEDDSTNAEDVERATDPALYEKLENRLKELSDGVPMVLWAPRLFTREDGTPRSLKERLELQIMYQEAEAKAREAEAMTVRPVRTRQLSYPDMEESPSMITNTPWFKEFVESPEKMDEFLSQIGSPVEKNPIIKPQNWAREHKIFDPALDPPGTCACHPDQTYISSVWTKVQVSGQDSVSPVRSGAILELRGQCHTCGKLIPKSDPRGLGEAFSPSTETWQRMARNGAGNESGTHMQLPAGPSRTWKGNQSQYGYKVVAEDNRWILGAPPPSKNGVENNSAKKRKRKTKKRIVISKKTLTSTETSPKTPPKMDTMPKAQRPKKRKKPVKKVL